MPVNFFQKPGSRDVSQPATFAAAVTPDDATDLTYTARAIYIGGAGNVKVDMVGSSAITFSNVPAGTVLPIRVERVYSTGTTATSIVAIW